MNNIIKELLESGISITMQYNKEKSIIEYIVGGFYKSGTITLHENEDKTLTSMGRYDQKRNIDSIRDLVELNYDWWQSSKDRFDGWSTPEENWIPLLLKFEFISEETKVLKTYK